MDGSGSKPGVPLAACQGSVSKTPHNVMDGIPHNATPFIHIPLRISNYFDIGP